MLRNALLFPAVLLLSSASLIAQNTFVSPAGYANTEANNGYTIVFGTTDRTFQQVDATNIGTVAPNISAIAWRRDSTQSTSAPTGGTATVRLFMGHGTYVDPLSTTFASNYLGTSRTEVFTPKVVNFPDWSQAPATPPAPFDFQLTLDTPFSYNGTDALVWELVWSGWSGTSSNDADRYLGSTSSYNSDTGTNLGTGCTTANGTYTAFMTLYNYGPNHSQYAMRIYNSIYRAPSNQAVFFALGLTDLNAALPGLCTTVHSDGAVANFPLGVADATGRVGPLYLDLPYVSVIENATFVGQYYSLDPLSTSPIQIALTQGEEATMEPAPMPGIPIGYVYTSGSTTYEYVNRGVVTQFSY